MALCWALLYLLWFDATVLLVCSVLLPDPTSVRSRLGLACRSGFNLNVTSWLTLQATSLPAERLFSVAYFGFRKKTTERQTNAFQFLSLGLFLCPSSLRTGLWLEVFAKHHRHCSFWSTCRTAVYEQSPSLHAVPSLRLSVSTNGNQHMKAFAGDVNKWIIKYYVLHWKYIN